MANVKISALPAATTVAASDLLPVVQGGVTKQVTPDLLPISAAAAAALGGKAPLASPAFTGSPTIGGTAVAKTTDVAALSLSLPVNTVTTSGTAVIGARNSVNASAGPVTIALPTPTAVGQHLILERADASNVAANAITVTGTIRNAPSNVVLNAVGAAFEGALYIAESLTSWAIAASIKPRAVLDAAYDAKGAATSAVAAQAATDAATYATRKTLLRALRNIQDAFPAVASSPPTITWYGPNGSTPIGNAQVRGHRTQMVTLLGMTPSYDDANFVTTSSSNGAWSTKVYGIEFDHTGQDVIVVLRDSSGDINDRPVRVYIDGQPATAYTMPAVGISPSTSNTFRLRLQFAAFGRRRVRVMVRGAIGFRGIEYAPLDTVSPTPRPSLRVAVLGDSYVDGANFGSRTITDGVLNGTTTITSASAAFTSADVKKIVLGAGIPAGARIASVTNGTTAVLDTAATASTSGTTLTISNDGVYDIDTWPQVLGRLLGAEMFSMGQGGTGYMNVATLSSRGAYTDSRRLASIAACTPNLVVIAGSVNDDTTVNGFTGSQIQTAAASVYAALAVSLPGVPVIVIGPQAAGQGSSTVQARFDAAAAVATAAAAAPNVLGYIDSVGGTSTPPAWAASTVYAAGAYVSYQGGVYKCVLAHTSAGAFVSSNWDQASWLTGPGYSLFPSGIGSRDTELSNDQVHLTELGHVHYALRALSGIANLLPRP